MSGMGHNSMAQTVFRAHGDRGYTKLRNEFLQDARISDETRGLIARLLSRPSDWNFTVKEIIASGPSGRDKVYRMIKEAEAFGYVMPDTPRREDGTFRSHGYLVTDDPEVLIQRAAKEILDIQEATSGKAGNGQPLPAQPDTENPEMDEIPDPLPAQPLPAQPDLANRTLQIKEEDKGKNLQTEPSSERMMQQRNIDFDEPEAKQESPPGFEEWWGVYPRKVGKGECSKLWGKMRVSERRRAMEGLRLQLATLVAKATDKRGNFCPHPATWLRQGRFDDEPADTPSQPIPRFEPNPGEPPRVFRNRLRSMFKQGKISIDVLHAHGITKGSEQQYE